MLGQEVGSIQHVLYLLAGSAFWTAIISPLILKSNFLHSRINLWIAFAAMNQRSRLNLLVIQNFIASLMFALFGRLFICK